MKLSPTGVCSALYEYASGILSVSSRSGERHSELPGGIADDAVLLAQFDEQRARLEAQRQQESAAAAEGRAAGFAEALISALRGEDPGATTIGPPNAQPRSEEPTTGRDADPGSIAGTKAAKLALPRYHQSREDFEKKVREFSAPHERALIAGRAQSRYVRRLDLDRRTGVYKISRRCHNGPSVPRGVVAVARTHATLRVAMPPARLRGARGPARRPARTAARPRAPDPDEPEPPQARGPRGGADDCDRLTGPTGSRLSIDLLNAPRRAA